jgi:hypothetical protein
MRMRIQEGRRWESRIAQAPAHRSASIAHAVDAVRGCLHVRSRGSLIVLQMFSLLSDANDWDHDMKTVVSKKLQQEIITAFENDRQVWPEEISTV